LPPPRTSWICGYQFNSSGFNVASEQEDGPVQLARLLLKKAPAEPQKQAAHLMDLSDAYRTNNLTVKAGITASYAEKIYRSLLEKSPDDLSLERDLAMSLVSQDRFADAEKLYRDGVQK